MVSGRWPTKHLRNQLCYFYDATRFNDKVMLQIKELCYACVTHCAFVYPLQSVKGRGEGVVACNTQYNTLKLVILFVVLTFRFIPFGRNSFLGFVYFLVFFFWGMVEMEYLSLQLGNTPYMASLSHNSVYPPRFIFESIILGKRGGGAGSGSQKEGCFRKGDML